MSRSTLRDDTLQTQRGLSIETTGAGTEQQNSHPLNEVIVKFKDGIQDFDFSGFAPESGMNRQDTTQSPLFNFELWSLDEMTAAEAIAQYQDHPAIDYIQPNYTITATNTIPTDPHFDSLWGLHNTGQTGGTVDADIDAPEAWNITQGEGVVIGVIDTGVDYTHPDLVDQMWTNPGEIANNGIDDDGNGYVDDYYGYDFAYNDANPFDGHSHGTHVAGTIAATQNNALGISGVAPKAQIMAIKFLSDSGSGSTFNAIKAVEYATMMGANLTNNSWGGGGYSQALYDAIAAAGDAGQLFIASAGNSGMDNDTYPHYPSNYELDNIISVAATNHYDQLAYFSHYGSTTVDLGAPGQNILSTIPGGGYASYSGTSMAAPHVSGAAALVWSANPDLTAAEVKAQLLNSVDPLESLIETVSGGRLNAHAALMSLLPPTLATIHGHQWYDLNGDGTRDSNEPGLWNQTVFLDTNQNGQLDEGELSTTTDAYGAYQFTNLAPGTYTVAQIVPPAWQQTVPDRNGSFETGDLTNWQGLGTTNVQTANYGVPPTDGSFQALLTSQGSGSSDTSVATFLGLSPFQLDSLGNGNATAGAALKQTVTVSAGTQMTMAWNFLTNEGTPTSYNDFAFISITGGNGSPFIQTLANTYSSFQFSGTPFNEETGYHTFTHTFTHTGTYTLGFGVMDVGDTIVDSGLLIDEIQFNGTVTTAHTVTVGSGTTITDLDFAGHQPVIHYGTADDETLRGTVAANTIHGLQGDDLILGHEGDDYLFGGEDQDDLRGQMGEDHLFGGKDNDRLFGGEGNDLLNGGEGADFLNGGDGNDALLGGFGNDDFRGGNGDDELWGETGNDTLVSGNGDDFLSGGDGLDLLKGGADQDVLLGGANDDRLFGEAGDDWLYGGKGDDLLNGGSGNDFLRGGNGDDRLIGGQGQDTFALVIGEGTDEIHDFDLAQDLFGLVDGLSLGQLEITQTQNDAVIGFQNQAGILATVNGVNAVDLIAAQDSLFVTV